jgi:hypothetical protein
LYIRVVTCNKSNFPGPPTGPEPVPEPVIEPVLEPVIEPVLEPVSELVQNQFRRLVQNRKLPVINIVNWETCFCCSWICCINSCISSLLLPSPLLGSVVAFWLETFGGKLALPNGLVVGSIRRGLTTLGSFAGIVPLGVVPVIVLLLVVPLLRDPVLVPSLAALVCVWIASLMLWIFVLNSSSRLWICSEEVSSQINPLPALSRTDES